MPPHTPSKKSNQTALDENLNPTPKKIAPSESLRHQFQAQIVDRFEQHRALLRYIRSTYQKQLKPILTVHQMSSLFGNLKHLLTVHEKVYKQMAQVNTSKEFDSGFEKSLARLFTGKIGKSLEIESNQFCITQREANRIKLITSLQEDPKVAPLLNAQPATESPWSQYSLGDLLELVTNYLTQYPLLIDQLLQETPLNTMAYLHLEQALNSARNMAKVITEAKDFLGEATNNRKQSFLGSMWQTFTSWVK